MTDEWTTVIPVLQCKIKKKSVKTDKFEIKLSVSATKQSKTLTRHHHRL